MRESGFDISFRFGPFSGSTHHYAAVGLNSLLYHYEQDLAEFARMVNQVGARTHWMQRPSARRQAINKYLWNPGKGMFFDYDFTTGQTVQLRLRDNLLSSLGRPGYDGTGAAVDKNLALLDRPGGLACSTYASGLQWDLPFGWAPLNWFAVTEAVDEWRLNDARRIAEQFTERQTNFKKEGTIHEKYNVETGSSNVEVIAGYQNVWVSAGQTRFM